MKEHIHIHKKTQREELTREEENVLYWIGVIAFPITIIGAYFAVNWVLPNIPSAECIFWRVFGAYCPGCGGTRSVVSLVHGQVLRSIWYHPLIMYTVVMYLLYMITHTMEKLHVPYIKGIRFRSWYIYVAIVIIALNCIFKNVLLFGFGIAM